MSTQLKVATVCLLLMAWAFCGCQKQSSASQQDTAPPRGGRNYEQEMIQVANELNKQIEQNNIKSPGSEDARLRRAIGGPGSRLTLVMQVASLEAAPLSPAQMRQQVEEKDLNNICRDEHFKLLLQHDITIVIRLLGKEETIVGDLSVTRKDCGY